MFRLSTCSLGLLLFCVQNVFCGVPRVAVPVSYSYGSTPPEAPFDLQVAAAEPRAVTADIVKHPVLQSVPAPVVVSNPSPDASEKVEKVLLEPKAFSFNVPSFEKKPEEKAKGEASTAATIKRKRQSRRHPKTSLQASPIVVIGADEISDTFKRKVEQPQAQNSERHEHIAAKQGDGKQAESKVEEQQAANSDHHHKKEHHEGHEKGGGKKHHDDHHHEKGEKEHKVYKGGHEHEKVEHGHHDKEGHKGHYHDEGGHKKKHHEEHDHYGEHHEGEEGKKGAQYAEKGEHTKGHSTKGEHNIHKKDEYEKKHEFYDEHHEGGEHEKQGGFHEEHDHKKGEHHKASHHKGGHEEGHYGKKEHHDKGHHYDQDKGHKSSGGHEHHHGHGEKHAKKGGHAEGKKHGFKKSGGGGDNHGHGSEQVEKKHDTAEETVNYEAKIRSPIAVASTKREASTQPPAPSNYEKLFFQGIQEDSDLLKNAKGETSGEETINYEEIIRRPISQGKRQQAAKVEDKKTR